MIFPTLLLVKLCIVSVVRSLAFIDSFILPRVLNGIFLLPLWVLHVSYWTRAKGFPLSNTNATFIFFLVFVIYVIVPTQFGIWLYE